MATACQGRSHLNECLNLEQCLSMSSALAPWEQDQSMTSIADEKASLVTQEVLILSSNACRSKSYSTAPDRPDPVLKWKGERTLLIFWLAAAIVTFISSLWWLKIGMWAGVIGIIGPSLTICGCCSSRRLPLNVHVSFTSFLKSLPHSRFSIFLFKVHFPNMMHYAEETFISFRQGCIAGRKLAVSVNSRLDKPKGGLSCLHCSPTLSCLTLHSDSSPALCQQENVSAGDKNICCGMLLSISLHGPALHFPPFQAALPQQCSCVWQMHTLPLRVRHMIGGSQA